MTTLVIDKNKRYRTRDGREVRIYATDGKAEWPVHGAVWNEDGWLPVSWMSDGRWSHQNTLTDLIEVKPRIKREVWVNVYRGRETDWVTMHDERDEADAERRGQRIACVKLTIDCEEGEGL